MKISHGLLNGMQVIILDSSYSFYCGDMTPIRSQDRHQASIHRQVFDGAIMFVLFRDPVKEMKTNGQPW